MSDRNKMSLQEKEKKLLNKIESAKKELDKFQKKRRLEIGQLACKYGLDKLDNDHLEQLFFQLSNQHKAA
jgi:uncharacterized protein YlxW (UPF0749 family)